MSRRIEGFNLTIINKIMAKCLGCHALYRTRRGEHWWWSLSGRDHLAAPIFGVQLVEYSPGVLRLTTAYADGAAALHLRADYRGLVSRRSYELSFAEDELKKILPWALSDITKGSDERPEWAYKGYWHRHEGGGAYLWSAAGWELAEKQRATRANSAARRSATRPLNLT